MDASPIRRVIVEGMPILERDLSPDGPTLYLQPLLWGYAQLGISGPIKGVYRDSWQYQDLSVALIAFCTWDGEGEPEGWYKHAASGRRRPDGDPALEFIKED